MSACDKGYKGCCCCNCDHQRQIMKHPANKKVSPAHGSIMEQMGWGCELPDPDVIGKVYFMHDKHGMCELHTPRNYEKYSIHQMVETLSS